MSSPPDDRRRQVIPRWRTFQEAVTIGELGAARVTEPDAPDPAVDLELQRIRSEWTDAIKRDDAGAEAAMLAAELIGTGLAVGRPDDIEDAVRYLEETSSLGPETLHRLAGRGRRLILQHPSFELTPPPNDSDAAEAQRQVHGLRNRLRNNPHNPIAWAELARSHAILGEVDKSIREMTVAVELAGPNRFLLRSAGRLFVHAGDTERAHSLIAGSALTPDDPWLIAAEIATAHVAGNHPQQARRARRALESKRFSPFEMSELTSALATLELASGSDRRSRQLFRASLQEPHENSVAQAEWASTRLGGLEVDPRALAVPNSHEARARDAINNGDWKAAFEECRAWQHVEPFSSEPALHASYIASVALKDFELVIDVTERALVANPEHVILRNNKAYGLANLGRTAEALKVLEGIKTTQLSERDRAPILATLGLIAYRNGETDTGRALYESSLLAAKRSEVPDLHSLVQLYHALEEIRAGTDAADDIAERALDATSHLRTHDVRLLRLQLERSLEERTER